MVEQALERLGSRATRSRRRAGGRDVFGKLGVVRLRCEFGEDRDGESAVWVYVIVSDDTPLGVREVGPRITARLRIRDALEKAGWKQPIYTRFRRESEDT